MSSHILPQELSPIPSLQVGTVGVGRSVGGSVGRSVGRPASMQAGRQVSRRAGRQGRREGAMDGGLLRTLQHCYRLPMLCTARALSQLVYVITRH